MPRSPEDPEQATSFERPRQRHSPGSPPPETGGSANEGVEATILVAPSSHGSGRPPPARDRAAPQPDGTRAALARFDLLEPLGQGAMGVVLLARDRDLGRKVAYKRLRGELGAKPDMVQRFLAEAQITAQLDHPNVVPLYSLEHEDAQQLGYAMKLVQGETLESLIRQARSTLESGRILPPRLQRETLLDHFLKICDAIAFAHSRGVIHRDLKPANIMVGHFHEVYVMDWGIARVLESSRVPGTDMAERVSCARSGVGAGMETADGIATTQCGSLLGTPKYMSPEQARGEIDQLDERSDLYSLGLILFELICLRPAFGGPDVGTLLDRIQRGQRQPVAAPSPRGSIPRELKAIVDKATQAEPTERYQSAADLAEDLRHHLRGEAVSALRDNPLQSTLRWIGHHRQRALNLFLATLLIGFLATGALWYRHTVELEKIHERQILTARYFDFASAQAQIIVKHFLFMLGLLEGLSVGAELALEDGKPAEGRYYTHEDFVTPGSGPKDLATSASLYRDRPISTDVPVVFFPQGVVPTETERKIRQLLPLKALFQRIILEAHDEQEVPPSGRKVRETLDRHDITVDWMGIALREGAMVGYPGLGGFSATYDPIARPWYRQAVLAQGGKVCGEPYVSASLSIFIMSCSVALYSNAGEFFGVAEIDLPLEKNVEKILLTPQLPLVRALLLNDQGQILVEARPDTIQGVDLPKERLRAYSNATIVEAIKAGHSGQQNVLDADRKLWVMYLHLRELKWTYVVELDEQGARHDAK
ncbi:serine/threonine protein kinase [Thiocystis violascens]|uniref:Serine/threonine protein kinase n=1 Tax=Thiocystis violascens (strain ATCC 17096 / DSM 198 / 6111) TaxID=765911 RepID=I3Y733_THIV6|nr:serine/threonine protein kinase [Thiocystis violascens]AFL72801.1 serine/threonine protein kinase [Thiocystis violascens DSM 198]